MLEMELEMVPLSCFILKGIERSTPYLFCKSSSGCFILKGIERWGKVSDESIAPNFCFILKGIERYTPQIQYVFASCCFILKGIESSLILFWTPLSLSICFILKGIERVLLCGTYLHPEKFHPQRNWKWGKHSRRQVPHLWGFILKGIESIVLNFLEKQYAIQCFILKGIERLERPIYYVYPQHQFHPQRNWKCPL